MPRGPQKQWRPAGTAECAVHVMRIATGELDDTFEPPSRDADTDASERASVAGKARAASLTPEQRSEIARKGGKAKAAAARRKNKAG